MAFQQPQLNAVNISPERKVRIELIRRGRKTGDLARSIGLTPDTVTNVLCGKRHLSARRAIEDVLGMPFWSTPEEFSERQRAANQTTKSK